MPEVLTFPQGDLPLGLKRQVLAILEAAWPTGRGIDERLGRPLHDPRNQPQCMLLENGGGEVLSYLAIPSRAIEHAGVTYRVSGLSAVATHPEQLRRGHGARLVSAARAHIEAGGADLGVFTCDPPLVPFYVEQGWTFMRSTVVVGGTRERPFRADELDKRTLMAFFTPLARAHRSDFEGADVHLDLREGDLW